ncbi:MAG: tRNA lysidine(34) synthetase TilS [Eubacteriales bacterium]
MISKVQVYIEKYQMIEEGDCLIVGVSGGPDSMCLLNMLLELKGHWNLKIHVIHVNHQIREEAIEEASFVKEYCKKNIIPYHYVSEDVRTYAKEHHISEEEAGRIIRYEAFNQLFQELTKDSHCKIAVGHNQNDRAETMIFHLTRGTGLTGLQSMLPCRGNIIRPILCLNRIEIEEYLKERNVEYCTDQSNFSKDYTRNQIRHKIVPCMEMVNDKTIEHMNETATILEEVETYLMKQVDMAYEACVTFTENHYGMNLESLKGYDAIIQQYLVRKILYQCSGQHKNFTMKHIKAVLGLLYKEVGKYVMLPYKVIGKREYQRLCIYRKCEVVEEKEILEFEVINFPSTLTLLGRKEISFSVYNCGISQTINIEEKAYTKCFDYDRIKEIILVRTRREGDYIALNDPLSRKSLNRYMITAKISKEIRDEKLLLADGSHIMWVIGGRISEYYKVTSQTTRILEVRLREDIQGRKGRNDDNN